MKYKFRLCTEINFGAFFGSWEKIGRLSLKAECVESCMPAFVRLSSVS